MQTAWPFVLVMLDVVVALIVVSYLWLGRVRRSAYLFVLAGVLLCGSLLSNALILLGYHNNLILGFPLVIPLLGTLILLMTRQGFAPQASPGVGQTSARWMVVAAVGVALLLVVSAFVFLALDANITR